MSQNFGGPSNKITLLSQTHLKLGLLLVMAHALYASVSRISRFGTSSALCSHGHWINGQSSYASRHLTSLLILPVARSRACVPRLMWQTRRFVSCKPNKVCDCHMQCPQGDIEMPISHPRARCLDTTYCGRQTPILLGLQPKEY